MRNIMKPAATASSRTRRSVRGVAAVVASLALAAGLGSYPVDAQEPVASATDSAVADAGSASATTPSVAPAETVTSETSPERDVFVRLFGSATAADAPASAETSGAPAKPAFGPNLVAKSPVTWTRDDNVDHIVVEDPEGEAWEFGGKASDENVFALKRIGKGEIEEVLSVTADERELEPYDFGFLNTPEESFVAFNLNALHTIPPQVVDIKVRTTDAGEYAIAESDEVPTVAELEASGFAPERETDRKGESDAFARAATQANSTISLSTSPLSYSNISGASGNMAPRGTLKTSVVGKAIPQDVYLTELVLTHNNQQAKYSLSGPITVRKNGGTEWCTVQPVNIKNLRTRTAENGGSVSSISIDLSSCDPQIVVWQGYGNSIDIDFNGPATGSASKDYSVELYGSHSRGGATKKFSVVPATGSSVQLEPQQTTGSNPFTTTSVFEKRTKFEKALVEVKAPNGVLAVENYGFSIDLLESGTKLERKVISATKDTVVFEVYPVKDGKRVESVLVEKGATLTLLSRFSDNPSQVESKVTVYGTTVERPKEDTEVISEPDRAEFLEGRVKNPPLPAKCGLKIAIVADVSTSLQYADGVNAFEQTRNSAKALVNTLAGTSTRVGIYSFARTAQSQTPRGAISIQDQQGADEVNRAIDSWVESSGGATNWEAALTAVQGQAYDAVYFITDGMPTWDNSGWQPLIKPEKGQMNTGAFVQATSLKRAVDAANTLKADGTRIVPLMVDLKLGTAEHDVKPGSPVEGDYVLKDALPGHIARKDQLGMSSVRTLRYPEDYPMLYPEKSNSTVVNAKLAVDKGYLSFAKDGKKVTKDQSKWTYGYRKVLTMGEDISGDGDAIRVEGGYAKLQDHFDQIAKKLIANCESSFVVQKNIVDEHGKILTEGASGWEFTTTADKAVLDPGDAKLVSKSAKTTGDQGQVAWRVDSMESTALNVQETQQGEYKLRPVNGANARCTQTNGDFTVDVPVENDGDDGFKVDVPAFSKVTCVVSNYQRKDELVKLELKKLDSTDKSVLSNAKFEVRSEREGEGPFAVTWDAGSQTYKTEAKLGTEKSYLLVETQAPTKDGQQYSLLVAPVEFRIVSGGENGGYLVQVWDGQKWITESIDSGLWTERPKTFDAATGYLQVANVRQGDLPKTGGAGLRLPILLGGALIAAGALVGRRKVAA